MQVYLEEIIVDGRERIQKDQRYKTVDDGVYMLRLPDTTKPAPPGYLACRTFYRTARVLRSSNDEHVIFEEREGQEPTVTFTVEGEEIAAGNSHPPEEKTKRSRAAKARWAKEKAETQETQT